MKIHEVKTNSGIFQEVWMGRKFAELRWDDRDYKIGDILVQKEWKLRNRQFTNRSVSAKICGITWVSHWIGGVDGHWCILHLDHKTFKREKS